MTRQSWFTTAALACALGATAAPASIALETELAAASPAANTAEISESTMPPSFTEVIKPELAGKYTYKQDGEFTAASHLPTYEWMPTAGPPRVIVVGVHGLTLHGRRYRVLARVFANAGVGFISMDMRGFGRCKFDPNKQFSTAGDDRTKVNHEKSYEEIVALVKAARNKYPGQRLVVLGESLGCTFAVRLAAEHKELVDGIVLSAPAVKLNPKMYVGHGNVARAAKAVVVPGHNVNLNAFMRNLVSPRQPVVSEMLDDPFILKELPLSALISTDDFVGKTSDWGAGVSKKLPVLIIQGSIDNCVSAKHVTGLMNQMPSDDQTLAWRGNYGHLQLETVFVRATVLNALVNWLYDHSVEMKPRLDNAQQNIEGMGGKIVE
jgi:acylglycerol lipase